MYNIDQKMGWGLYQIMRKIIACLCLIFTVIAACGCSSQVKDEASGTEGIDAGMQDSTSREEEDDADSLILQIISCYADAVDDAGQLSELLERLSDIDEVQGELWKSIMAYWDMVNTDLQINIDKLPDDLEQGDSLCMVVLGFELNDDGSMKDELIGRLELALACARQYPQAYILCTGGGTAKNNKAVTEADLMGSWLIENGLEEERLMIENRSLSTVQNAEFSYEILREDHPQIDSVVIVSSSYHVPWGSLLFEAEFLIKASEGEKEIHVLSNAAYDISNEKYSDLIRFEARGLMQLAQDN